jgi:hypothetical protein
MALDTLVLNGLNINDETSYGLEAIDIPAPTKRLEWATSVDSDGEDLIRVPKYNNRVVTMTLRVGPQTTMDLALAKLGALIEQAQESELNPGGTPLEYSPAGSTKTYTLDVLTGAVAELPMVNEGPAAGFYAKVPQLKLVLTCKPFGRTAEVVGSPVANETGLSVVVLTIPTLPGDVPAEGRLIVKDTAAVGRRTVEWGIENRYYNAATSLVLDSEDMTPVAGAQSTALNTLGAYKRAGATKGTIATTLLPEPTICFETGALGHVGTFRVKHRMQISLGSESLPENVHVRLSYQDGEGPFRANTWQTPVLGGKLIEVDLGVVTITEKLTGTQRWAGRVEAYSDNGVALDTHHGDYLIFVPVLEGYGRARGVQSSAPGTIVAFDNFSTGTLSGNLNGRTPATGAAWATSGATTDWAVTSGHVSRSTKSDASARLGVLGPALINTRVGIATLSTSPDTETLEFGVKLGAILRWVDSSNYAVALAERAQFAGATFWSLQMRVAGVLTVFGIAETAALPESLAIAITAEATADGALSATFKAAGKSISLSGSSAALATGGALASGKCGVYDFCAAPVSTRLIESVSVQSLPAVPYCIQPSQSMQVRSDSAITTDPTGAVYGPVQQYRGSHFFPPQDGSANRTSRVIVKADRNDLNESDQQTIGDSFTVTPAYTPRYLVIPH